jgi:hypothetical protein
VTELALAVALDVVARLVGDPAPVTLVIGGVTYVDLLALDALIDAEEVRP